MDLLQKDSTTLLITIKTEGTAGYVFLAGGEKIIEKENLTKIGEEICFLLDGKGSLQRDNVYQAKVNKINALSKAQKLAVTLGNELCK